MSTTDSLMSDNDVAGMVEDLKKWPSTAVDNGEYELAVMPFITFYFTYAPAHYLATSLAMIEVHEAFERLAGKPYKIATHPDSERPHPYGSKRLGDLREWARKTRIDKSFLFNFTDEKNHRSSPTTAGYSGVVRIGMTGHPAAGARQSAWRVAGWRTTGVTTAPG
ncbi:hypothetical protein ACKI2N_009975 [Cupriavidus sp. 30B13]|uniref:hypothetical protein n=1 Tax=Cupriavidus sp. 30B13 TaxID=3384241 RepID=UPI003B9096A8